MLIPGVSNRIDPAHKEYIIAVLSYVADILSRRARETINAEVTMYRAGDVASAKYHEGRESAFDEATEFVMWYVDQHKPEDEREGYEPPKEVQDAND